MKLKSFQDYLLISADVNNVHDGIVLYAMIHHFRCYLQELAGMCSLVLYPDRDRAFCVRLLSHDNGGSPDREYTNEISLTLHSETGDGWQAIERCAEIIYGLKDNIITALEDYKGDLRPFPVKEFIANSAASLAEEEKRGKV